jgi:hypothetical protein
MEISVLDLAAWQYSPDPHWWGIQALGAVSGVQVEDLKTKWSTQQLERNSGGGMDGGFYTSHPHLRTGETPAAEEEEKSHRQTSNPAAVFPTPENRLLHPVQVDKLVAHLPR